MGNWFRAAREEKPSQKEFNLFEGGVKKALNNFHYKIDLLELENKNLCKMFQDITKRLDNVEQQVEQPDKIVTIASAITEILDNSTNDLHLKDIYNKIKDRKNDYKYDSCKSTINYLLEKKRISRGKKSGYFKSSKSE